MKHLDYFNRNREALINKIDGNINDQIKEPIVQRDVEDWVRWNMNNVPNEYERKVLNNFLDHFFDSEKMKDEEKRIKNY